MTTLPSSATSPARRSQALLKLLEGATANVPPQGGRASAAGILQVDTTNMLSVCGGASTGREKMISARSRPGSNGFGAGSSHPRRESSAIFREIEPEDFLGSA